MAGNPNSEGYNQAWRASLLSALGVPPVNEADIDCRMFVGYALEEGRKQQMLPHENLRRWAEYQEEAICEAEKELELDTADQFCNYLADQIEQRYVAIPCDDRGEPWRDGDEALTDTGEIVIISGIASKWALYAVRHYSPERELIVIRADKLRRVPKKPIHLTFEVGDEKKSIPLDENPPNVEVVYSKDVCHHCGGHLEEFMEYLSANTAKRPPRYGRSQDKVLKACEKCGLVYLKEI